MTNNFTYTVKNISKEDKTMQINRIRMKGFKNIEETVLDFSEIIALISPNNYGKSNIMDAIDFAIDFINSTASTHKNLFRYEPAIPISKVKPSKDFIFEIEMTTPDENEYVQYGFCFDWVRNDDSGAKITKEWLKIKDLNSNKPQYSQYINRTEKFAKYKKAQTGRCDNNIKIKIDELVINKIKEYDVLYYIEKVRMINKLSVHIEKHLDAKQVFDEFPFTRKNSEIIEMSNLDDLPRILYSLKNEHPNRYNMLLDSYRILFPNFGKVFVLKRDIRGKIETEIQFGENSGYKLADDIYRIYVEDNTLNQPINFLSTSDGAKRVLLILTASIIAELKGISLIGFEEVEYCIHPRLLQSLLRVLSQIVGRCRVIITSHSPYLINYFDIENLYIGLPLPCGKARFRKFKKMGAKKLIREAEELGVLLGELIFDLLSGSKEDFIQLAEYLDCDDCLECLESEGEQLGCNNNM